MKEAIADALQKIRHTTQNELKKHLLVADPAHGTDFLNQIKVHYENRVDDPEMSHEKLWYLAMTAMRSHTKVKWLERWNQSPALRDAARFPSRKFADHSFHVWLKKAVWWNQVLHCYFNSFIINFYSFKYY